MHLREEIFSGRWGETIPGAPTLAKELEVDRKAVITALLRLEEEGLLVAQGAGRKRRIVLPHGRKAVASIKIAILDYNDLDRQQDYMIHLQQRLTEAGHHAFFHTQTLIKLGMKVSRIRQMVKSDEADAWVVGSASSEVLQWFSKQPAPVFALFGRMSGLPIAGTKPDKAAPYADATRQLISLGHRRISLLAQSARRLPEPGHLESLFLKELESHGIQTSTYNLPDWDDSTEGFHQVLDTLFSIKRSVPLLITQTFFSIKGLSLY
jgi:DNA-binding LacI/PurR family transcriptional regulator